MKTSLQTKCDFLRLNQLTRRTLLTDSKFLEKTCKICGIFQPYVSKTESNSYKTQKIAFRPQMKKKDSGGFSPRSQILPWRKGNTVIQNKSRELLDEIYNPNIKLWPLYFLETNFDQWVLKILTTCQLKVKIPYHNFGS